MITGIGHLAFTVSDMEKSLDFYCSKLGFTDAFELKNDKGEPWIRYIKVAEGQFIELFYGEPKKAKGSYEHLCLAVDDINDIAREMKVKGVALLSGISKGKDGNYQCWVEDPDGNPIEFMQIMPEGMQNR